MDLLLVLLLGIPMLLGKAVGEGSKMIFMPNLYARQQWEKSLPLPSGAPESGNPFSQPVYDYYLFVDHPDGRYYACSNASRNGQADGCAEQHRIYCPLYNATESRSR